VSKIEQRVDPECDHTAVERRGAWLSATFPQRWPRRVTNSRRGHFFDAADQDSVLGTNVTGVTWLNTAGCQAPALASDERYGLSAPAPGPFLCADQSGTGDRCRNCLVTGDGGWHVTLAQTQSTGEPVQRVADTMVDRIFCSFSILTTRARLTSLTLENAPAALPRGGGGLFNAHALLAGREIFPHG
jgi:hypothetical protein